MKLENWTYLDSIYLAFITLFTIGYGDLVPAGKIDLCMFHKFDRCLILIVKVIRIRKLFLFFKRVVQTG